PDLFEGGQVVVIFDEIPLLARLELVGLGRGVLVAVWLGRVPWTVRAEEIEPEEKRRRVRLPAVEPVDRRPDGPRNSCVFFDISLEDDPVAEELLPATFPEVEVRIVGRREFEPRLGRDPDPAGARVS